jgi:hypothetical protein
MAPRSKFTNLNRETSLEYSVSDRKWNEFPRPSRIIWYMDTSLLTTAWKNSSSKYIRTDALNLQYIAPVNSTTAAAMPKDAIIDCSTTVHDLQALLLDRK